MHLSCEAPVKSSGHGTPDDDKRISNVGQTRQPTILATITTSLNRGKLVQCLHISDGIKQGHVYDVVQRVGAVVVITEDEREVNVILEDKRLRLTWVPLRPRDTKTVLAVRVEVVRESDDIVPQIPAFPKSWDEVRPMGLERRYQLRPRVGTKKVVVQSQGMVCSFYAYKLRSTLLDCARPDLTLHTY